MKVQLRPEFVGLPAGDDVTIANAGATVFWKLAPESDVTRVRNAITRHWPGIVLPPLPEPPQPETALRRATAGLKGKRRLVRPLSKGVWTIVDEKVRGETLDHDQKLTVRLDPVGRPVVSPKYSDEADAIKEGFTKYLDTFISADLSSWLSKTVDLIGGVTLREGGGFYFIPPGGAMACWRALTTAIEEVDAGTMYSMPSMRVADAAKAIVDGLSDEVWTSVDDMRKELISSDLGTVALGNRARDAGQLKAKVQSYEALLGTSLEKLRATIDKLDVDIAAAKMAAEAEEDAS